MEATTQIGTLQRATQIAGYHHGDDEYSFLDGFDSLDTGEHRTVYVDYETDTVYKIGIDAVNRHEVKVLADARNAGAEHAPEATLWTVEVTDPWAGRIACTVVAMPYLPEDGSVEHEGLIFWEAGDLNPANVHANGGKLWLIDAGGLW